MNPSWIKVIFSILFIHFMVVQVTGMSSYFYKKIYLPLRDVEREFNDRSEDINIDHSNDHSKNDGISHLISVLIGDHSQPTSRYISSFDEFTGGSDSSLGPPVLWPSGSIPFVLDDHVSRFEQTVYRAMRIIESNSCIRFKERELEGDFIVIKRGEGCYSSVGKKGGPQTVSLGAGCDSLGIVLHELMHVVGFYHLHQRPDRDRFLKIHWENINPAFINNFKLLSPSLYRISGGSFDYASIMMYGPTSFSRDRNRVTMTPTRSGVRLVDPAYKYGLSQQDIQSINQLYRCHQGNDLGDY